MSRNQGRSGVLRGELAAASSSIAAERDQAAGAQEDLLDLPTRFAGKRAGEQRRKAEKFAIGRGGRTHGATNIATRHMREFFAKQGLDPAMLRFRWLKHSPETLASELGCTKFEAVQFLDRIAADLMRYFYAPMAQAGPDGKPVPPLSINIGGQNVAVLTGMLPWMSDPEVARNLARTIEQSQAVTVEPAPPSHEPPSHGKAK